MHYSLLFTTLVSILGRVFVQAFSSAVNSRVNTARQNLSLASTNDQRSDRRSFLNKAGTTIVLSTSSSFIFTPNVNADHPSSVSRIGSASEILLPKMGLGAWAWGDSLFWGYNPKDDSDLQEVFDYALSKNLAFFDTAEIYGFGRSETLIGNFREEALDRADRVQVATKFAALPFRTSAKDVVRACKGSLKRLNPSGTTFRPIDLYQIHFPNAWANEEYWDGLAQCYEQGLVKAVGVSNYGTDAVRAIHSRLAERGIPLATNQLQLSLLYRFPVENGLLDTCNELGVKVLSYSPLALGFLSGKYNQINVPKGPRGSIAKTLFQGEAGESFDNLITAMKDISSNHDGASLSQVALNWTRAKGTIPIPGARNLKQAEQNISALDWDLSKEEIEMLDLFSRKVPAYISPDKSPFPKEDINTKLKMFDS